LVAEQEVGPYYIADELLRSDIVEGKPGVPLSLRIILLDSRTCKPLSNAAVDVWHCDPLGLYSGFTKQNPQGPGGPPPGFDPRHPGDHLGPPPEARMGPPPQAHPTDKLTFLRGIQLSDENGAVQFQTIFPGVYMGRTNHIHFKVRIDGRATERSYQEGHTSHTGQIFFPEQLSAGLMEHHPYSRHQIHRTTQAEDHIYGDQHGELSIARVTPIQDQNLAAGLRAELIAAVDPSATPPPARRRRADGPPV
jgi:protocatechuate 3,4-dioxygenase beta subunit